MSTIKKVRAAEVEDEKCSGRPQDGQGRRTELPGYGIKVCA